MTGHRPLRNASFLLSTPSSVALLALLNAVACSSASRDGNDESASEADTAATQTITGVGGKCLDVTGGNTFDTAKVDVTTCGGQAWQAWQQKGNTIIGFDGKCLDVLGGHTANGSIVDLYGCNGSGSQIWTVQGKELVNPQSGRCLSTAGGSSNDGTVVELFDCTNAANQLWNIAAPASSSSAGSGSSSGGGTTTTTTSGAGSETGVSTGANVFTGVAGKCVEVTGGNTFDTAPVDISDCGGQTYQSWQRVGQTVVGFDGKCLDVLGGKTANGATVEMYGCNGSGSQVWQAQGSELLNPQSGRCLSTAGGASRDGTVLQLWDCSNAASQQWAFGGAAPSSGSSGTSTSGSSGSSGSGSGSSSGTSGSSSSGSTSGSSDDPPAGYHLFWSDEFNGTSLDTSIWNATPTGNGGYNQELQYYNGPDTAVVSGGSLHMEALTLPSNTNLSCWYGTCKYSSPQLDTSGKFSHQYGRFAARMKVPAGGHFWPAFWMLGTNAGWPQAGEIDVMEEIGPTPSTDYGTLHGPNAGGSFAQGGVYKMPTGVLSDDFHVYAVEWKVNEIDFYFDDILYFTIKSTDLAAGNQWVWNNSPDYLLLDLAIGGDWPGDPDSVPAGTEMTVDWVRVYDPN